MALTVMDDSVEAGIGNKCFSGEFKNRQGTSIPLESGKDSLSHGWHIIRVRIFMQEKSDANIRAIVNAISYKGFMKHMVRRINEEMKRKGIVQNKLGELAGVSQSTVNRILNEQSVPLVSNIIGIAKALSVPVEYLVCESDVKALLYMQIADMTDKEINDLLFQVRRDQYFRKHPEALPEKSPHIPISAPKLKS